MTDSPIACTLTAGEYAVRTGELAALAARSLRAREETAAGVRLTFADSAQTEAELRAAIAAEARCCAFLRIDLARTGNGLVVDITGPEEARGVIAELFPAERRPPT